MRVEGLEFRASGLGFRVQGSGFRISTRRLLARAAIGRLGGPGSWQCGLGFHHVVARRLVVGLDFVRDFLVAWKSEFVLHIIQARLLGLGFGDWGLGFWVLCLDFGVWGLGFKGSGFRVPGLGFRV